VTAYDLKQSVIPSTGLQQLKL